ncbi:cold-shock protein [Bradyrhizobium sp. 6(2017)]|uniref:cold-shock protein n=1 Tax=Bradyrhizobium sp. 6(2017) TaxID=1197460 RepID=UPI0013E10E9E|nr:cold shock domain-containing protein [Bradyrhizobium sp. 6(2017)]QIG94420.1 cold shock domain-containing protein [Bradyrhizobium sp. 6(2017)]
MQHHGTLKFWNEARAFGFITADAIGDVFCHITGIAGHAVPPHIGAHLVFELVDDGKTGKPKAVNVKIEE